MREIYEDDDPVDILLKALSDSEDTIEYLRTALELKKLGITGTKFLDGLSVLVADMHKLLE